MISIDWKRFYYQHIITKYIREFVYERVWFGWWFASYCSAHQKHDLDCRLCRSGSWCRSVESGNKNHWKIMKHKYLTY